MTRLFLCLGLAAAVACGDDDGPILGDSGMRDTDGVDAGPGDGGGDDAPGDDGGGDDAGPEDDGGGVDAARTDAGPLVFPEGCPEDPPFVDLQVVEPGECDAFSACGGDIVGAWNLSGGCFELELMSAIMMCPGAEITRRDGQGRGCVLFGEDGIAHRVAESVVEIDALIPALCTFVVSCDEIESQIRSAGADGTCMTNDAGDCECMASQTFRIDDMEAYTTEGDEIVGTTSGKRWEYCVEGGNLTYQDTSPSGSREPGIIELTRP